MSSSSRSQKPTEATIIESEWKENGYEDFREQITQDIALEEVESTLKPKKQQEFIEDLEEELEEEIPEASLDDLEEVLPEHTETISEYKQEFAEEYKEVARQKIEELQTEMLEDPENSVKHNLDLLGVSLAINETYKQHSTESNPTEPLEVRGWAVFSHIYDVDGADAFQNWPKIWDTDKYFPAARESSEEDRISLDSVFRQAYGDIIEESMNKDNNEGTKYTADVMMLSPDRNTSYTCGRGFEADLIRPDVNENSEYSFDKDDTERIDFTDEYSFLVPSIEEMIRHKGTISDDNGEGHDEFREKDGTELVNLFYVAEEKDIDPQDLKREYDRDERKQIAGRLQQVVPDMNTELEGSYTPTRDYIEEFTDPFK